MRCRRPRWSFVVLIASVVAVLSGRGLSQGSPSSSSVASSAQPTRPKPAPEHPLDAGSVNKDVYRNSALGFTCRIPPGWVLRTQEMNVRENDHPNTNESKPSSEAAKTGRVLLAAFSRPPEAKGEDVNASILIAAESAASYPGLREAAQYFGPVTEVAKARGFEVKEEPYEFVVGTKTLVRGDFEKDVGTRVMLQSTLAILARGYVVSFTFIGGTEDEVEELVGGLSFRTPTAK